jgi:hypothetical protein
LNQAISSVVQKCGACPEERRTGQEAADLNGKIRAMETSFVWKITTLTVFGKRTQSHGKIFI